MQEEIQTITLALAPEDTAVKRYEELTIADDFMFGKIMQDKSQCKRLLEILLRISPDTDIAEPVAQGSVRVSPQAKHIVTDVRTHDDRTDYDIEMQKQVHADLPRRSRYYQAMLDIDFLEAGHEYTALRNNFVLFICMKDPFGKGLPVYTFRNLCEEDSSVKLDDGTTKVFYCAKNYAKIDDEEARSLMEYVATGTAQSSYTAELDAIIAQARTMPLWKREYMDVYQDALKSKRELREAEEKGIAIGDARGRMEGAQQAKRETARQMLAERIPVELICKITGLSEQEIQAL